MKIRVLHTAEELLEKLDALCVWAESIDLAYAWASTNGGKSGHWKALAHEKIRRALIGTQFAQTEPWVLKKLNEVHGRLRLVISSEGTFHPKLAIGRKGKAVRVIMGSSNLTTGGFSTNTELNLLVEGEVADSELRKFLAFFERTWATGSPLDEAWLVEYEKAWVRRPRGAGLVPHAALEPQSFDNINVDWDRYVSLILSQEGRPIHSEYRVSLFAEKDSYLSEFKKGKAAFGEAKRFSDLSLEDRRRVIGMGDSSGLLGTMRAAGNAKKVVFSFPERIGQQIDAIPYRGEIDLDRVDRIIRELTEVEGISIGVASRLLVAKRPDLFVSVNNGSRPALSRLIGTKVSKAKDYLTLLQMLWSTPWFRSPRPENAAEQRIWDHRVGILDSALYQHVERP